MLNRRQRVLDNELDIAVDIYLLQRHPHGASLGVSKHHKLDIRWSLVVMQLVLRSSIRQKADIQSVTRPGKFRRCQTYHPRLPTCGPYFSERRLYQKRASRRLQHSRLDVLGSCWSDMPGKMVLTPCQSRILRVAATVSCRCTRLAGSRSACDRVCVIVAYHVYRRCKRNRPPSC